MNALSNNERWDDSQPIYLQLRELTVARILDGSLLEGDALPSVRNLAVELQLNPITVSRAYQLLVDEGLVEKRRGVGMYVRDGARKILLRRERERFLEQEWPRVLSQIQRLGISAQELLQQIEEDDHD
ncbi:MAG: GntR family transcriptional regulator [Wenzhouxiangellaceae bacterium]